MGPQATFAVATFLVGVLLVLAWVYLTADNVRSRALLSKSIPLFALPIAIAPWTVVQTSIFLLVAVTCEEGLKLFAASREEGSVDRFWLVLLFGIWELTIDKPFWGFSVDGNLDRTAVAGLVLLTILPVFMHAATAAIYAFGFGRNLWVAFALSWVIHLAYNAAVRTFDPSFALVLSAVIIFAAIVAGLWPRTTPTT